MSKYLLAVVCAMFFVPLIGGNAAWTPHIAESITYHPTHVSPSLGAVFNLKDNGVWTSNGPPGSYLNLLAMAASDLDVLYLGTLGGVYKSVDGGVTWSMTATNVEVAVIQVAPDDPLTVYVGTIDGIYKTEDGGDTWHLAGLSGAEVNAIAIDPDNTGNVFAGTGDAYSQSDLEIVGVFKSANRGEGWEQVLYPDILDGIKIDSVEALLMDTNDSQTIYAGIVTTGSSNEPYGGLQRSRNGGESWENLQVYGNNHVEALAMTPGSYQPATLYAGTTFSEYRSSTDQGDSWETIYTPQSPDYIYLKPPVVIDPNAPTHIYITSYQGIYMSPDSGVNWAKFAEESLPAHATSITFDPRDSKIFVGPNQGGVYRSTSGGEIWEISYATNTRIMDLAVDPVNSRVAYASIWGYAFNAAKTTNGGGSWDVLENSNTHLSAVAIDPQNPSTIYAGIGFNTDHYFRIYRSINSGTDWTGITFLHCSPGECKTGVPDILISPVNPDHLLVAAEDPDGMLIRSRDGAGTWDELGSSTTDLAIDPNNPDIVYTISSFYTSKYIYRYNDVWGDSWSKIDITPEGISSLIYDIAVDNSSRVYVASYDGLRRWDGSGWMQFTNLPAEHITAIAIDDNSSPETIYIGTIGEGVYLTADGGANWSAFNEGLPNLPIDVMEVSNSQPKILYVGTRYGGVWTRELGSTGPSIRRIYIPSLLFSDSP